MREDSENQKYSAVGDQLSVKKAEHEACKKRAWRVKLATGHKKDGRGFELTRGDDVKNVGYRACKNSTDGRVDVYGVTVRRRRDRRGLFNVTSPSQLFNAISHSAYSCATIRSKRGENESRRE